MKHHYSKVNCWTFNRCAVFFLLNRPLGLTLVHRRSAELGIDISAILSRTKSILTFSLSSRDVDSLDLGGPLIYMSMLAVCHLLVRRDIHACVLASVPAFPALPSFHSLKLHL